MRQLHLLKLYAAAFTIVSASAMAAPAQNPNVEPQAVEALNKMGAYLRTLTSFEIKSETTTEEVLDNDQKVQFAGTTDYKVRRPNGFVITVADDRKVREFYYDGKSLTIFSPHMGFYATVPAPDTIAGTLKAAYDKFDIELPMEDLFRWGVPGDHRDDLTSGYVIGYASINGQDADQYAFREGDIDWQIWIARGDKPLPLKAVITTNSDDAKPEFTALLSWTPSATFTDETFAFKAPADAKPITMAKR